MNDFTLAFFLSFVAIAGFGLVFCVIDAVVERAMRPRELPMKASDEHAGWMPQDFRDLAKRR